MKQIIFLSVAVCTLASCSKQDNIKSNSTNPTVTNQTTPNTPSTPKGVSTLSVGGNGAYMGPDYACIPYPANCVDLPPVIVRPSASMLAALGDAEDGGSEDVARVFSSVEFKDVYDNLEDECRDKLTSGDYYIKKNFEDEDLVNYIFGTESPLSSDNMEFAIQFTKAE